MSKIIYLLVSLISSTIGSISGIGGGVIIKPTLDAISTEPISTINFLSSCTVFSMSIMTLIRNLIANKKIDFRESSLLGIGAIFGGLIGNKLFDSAVIMFPSHKLLAITQSVMMLIINAIVFFYIQNKARVKTLNLAFTSREIRSEARTRRKGAAA